MVALGDLLSLETIHLDVAVNTWRESIESAGALLQTQKISGETYTRKMIKNVEENGPYIVITPGFAFAHARADESVACTGMSFIRLKNPIHFGHEKNDPVRLVLALAAVDSEAHQSALAQLAKILSDSEKRRRLDVAQTPEDVLAIFKETLDTSVSAQGADPSRNKNLVLTVCGNGLGTSLFLKNTLEQVLDRWGWSPYLTVEATDTISARGKTGDADFILTSGEIAKTLGEVNIPVQIIQDFTSQREIDTALREIYDI